MKKQPVFIVLLCLLTVLSCNTTPPAKKVKSDRQYYDDAMVFFSSRNYFDSIPALEELREKFPLSPYAVLAELRLGDSHYHKKEYEQAVHYFDNFRRLHPSNRDVPYSIFMTGMCHFQQILSIDRDQTSAKEAVEYFKMLLELYPLSPYTGKALCKMSESKKRIAEHEFFIGSFYSKKENYQGAIERYTKLIKAYPQSISVDKVYFYLAEAVILSGNQEHGKNILKLLLKRFPDSDYAPESKALLGLHTPEEDAPEEKEKKGNFFKRVLPF